MASGFGQGFRIDGLNSGFGFGSGFTGPGVPSTQVIVGTPILAPALEGSNLVLTPASVSPASPVPTQTFTLYINSAPVVGYVNVSLATLLGYVWQAADEWLNAYVTQTLSSPNLPGSPITLSSNTVNVDGLDNFILLIQTDAGPAPQNPFPGAPLTFPATANDQFRFYANAASTYDIDWGDGTIQNAVTGIQTRTYATPGVYRVRTRNWSGATINFGTISATGGTDQVKLIEIQRWGTTAWTSCNSMFRFAYRVTGTFADAPNLSACTNTAFMFNATVLFNGSPNASMDIWDMSNVTTAINMFSFAWGFNQPIGSWDVSNITSFLLFFSNAILFNQDISGWDVTGATSLGSMFAGSTGAISFNQDISGWNVTGATSLASMFNNATSFNQNLGNWVLGNTVSLTNMFNNCGMSTENYSRTLIGWANERAATGNPNSRSLGATGRTYHNVNYGGAPYSDAVSARANLVAPTPGGGGWTIAGDALVP